MKKRILILTSQLGHGGVERTLLEALKVIDYSKFEVYLFLRYDNTALVNLLPESVKIVINKDGHYHRHPRAVFLHFFTKLFSLFHNDKQINKYQNILNDFIYKQKIQNPYKRFFRKLSFDVVISYTIHICTAMALEIPANKHYVFFHSSNPDFHRDITKKCFGRFDNIIAVSNSVKNLLDQTYPEYKKKIGLIRNYVDGDRIQMLSNQYRVDTAQYKKDFVITSVMRVDIEKGADLLISVAEQLKLSGVSFVWFIVGDGSTKRDIEIEIKEKNLTDCVIITGFVENPHPYIRCCDIFVHPAYEESFGLAIMEALILRKAIVSTDTMGARDVLEDGKFGLLTPINAQSIFEGVLKMIHHPEIKTQFENSYMNQNDVERNIYKEKWTTILDGGTV